jgi:Ca2+-transporting ATPase
MAESKFTLNNKGLTSKEAEKLLLKWGKNEIKLSKSKNWLIEYLKEFTEIFSIILIFAAGFSYLANEPIDTAIILAIIVINSLISFIQKFRADKAVESLQKLVSPNAVVIRNGQTLELKADQIVPGDLIVLSEGMRIPADAKILESEELYIGESILTGESVPVLKSSNKSENQIYMGTEVMSGQGYALVISTGLETKFGQIAVLTNQTNKEKSPLQKELENIGLFVSKITLIIAVIITTLTVFLQKRELLETLVFASSVAVAAVPEGLPATVTIALALGVQRLARKGAIVKQLSSVETLGCTSTIVSDKTGTLTKNEMTAVNCYTPFAEYQISGIGYNDKGQITTLNGINTSNILKKIQLISQNCNAAKIDFKTEKVIGDPTEGALLSLAAKIANKPTQIELVQTIPFNSVRKMMATLISHKNEKEILIKGAPDIVLENCTKIFNGEKIVNLTEKHKLEIQNKLNQMADKALRTIVLAYKPTNKDRIEEFDLNELVFAGLVGIIDPPRLEIKKAVMAAQKAGIRLIMCTGDYANTAKAIAIELNICKPESKVITGAELKNYPDEKLAKLLSKADNLIFARVNPEDKLRVVNTLKELGEIVAVTGDGVNDAPALKKADIGVAMGVTGTEVSKEAANMVLSKDNFNNIIDAIAEGRTTYNNLRKFIYYIFSCNIGELTVIILALLIGLPAPLTAILILAINVGTDVFPALALAAEKPEKDFMLFPPRKTSQKILESNFNIRFISMGITIGLIATIVFLIFLIKAGYQFGDHLSTDSYAYIKASTATFACLVIAQMFNSLNAKSEKQMYFKMAAKPNKYLLLAVLTSLSILFAIIDIPALNAIFKTTHLNNSEWLTIIGLSSIVYFSEEIRKYLKKTN